MSSEKRKWTGRMIGALLGASMSLNALALPAAAAEDPGSQYDVTFREIDDTYDLPEQYPAYGQRSRSVRDKEIERILIEFVDACVIERKRDEEWDPSDPDVLAMRDEIRDRQDEYVSRLEQEVFDGQSVDVLTRLDLAANAISIRAQASQIAKIEALDFVKKVTVEQKIYPVQDTEDTSLKTIQIGGTSGASTGIEDASLEGNSGQGTRIAILDTGLNVNHQVFNSDCYNESLRRQAQKKGESLETYKNSLDLFEQSDYTSDLITSLHVKDGDRGLKASDFFVSEKIPYVYNYADGGVNISHYDMHGDHGTHVTGIAAANSLIKNGASGYTEAQDMKGYASDAQIFVMKVFGNYGFGSDSELFAAIEDAITLGCDVANLSLSTNSTGYSTPGYGMVGNSGPTFGEIMDNLASQDIIVSCSSSNSGNWADGTNMDGKLKPGDTSFSTAGSPGTYSNTFAVASSEPNTFESISQDKSSINMNMSSFSSWGTPDTLELKPEVTAPGGYIYSSNGDASNTGYDFRSGTSMAAPALSGMIGVMSGWVDEHGLVEKLGENKRTIIQSMLMSTAIPIKDKNGRYYPVMQQGAGEVRIDQAVHGKLFIMMDESATESAADGKVKAELKDDKERRGSYTTRIHLEGIEKNEDIRFGVEKHLFTQEVDEEGNLLSTTRPLELKEHSQDTHLYMLENGRKSGFNVVYELTDAEKERLNRDTPDGAYIEGFITIRLYDSDGYEKRGETVYSIPVFGYFGDWDDVRVFEDVSLYSSAKDDSQIAYVLDRDKTDGRIHTNMLRIQTGNGSGSRYLAGNPYLIEDGTEDINRSALNSSDRFADVTCSLVRDASIIRSAIFDENKSLIESTCDNTYHLRNYKPYKSVLTPVVAWADQTRTYPYNMSDPDGYGAFTPSKQYYFVLAALPESTGVSGYQELMDCIKAGSLKDSMKLEFPFVIDDTKPQMKEVRMTDAGLELTVHDNRYTAAAALVDEKGNVQKIAAPQSADKPDQDQTITIPVEKQGTGTWTVVVGDYARNETAYEITVEESGSVSCDLTHMRKVSSSLDNSGNLLTVLAADAGYMLPESITVLCDGKPLAAGRYTWSSTTGTVMINSALLNGHTIVIQAAGVADHREMQVVVEKTNVSMPEVQAFRNTDFQTVFTPDASCRLSSTISVFIDSALIASNQYTYNAQTGALLIPASVMRGSKLKIVVSAVRAELGEILLESGNQATLTYGSQPQLNTDCSVILVPARGWVLPEKIEVYIEGQNTPLIYGREYTYDGQTGTVVLKASVMNGKNITIRANLTQSFDTSLLIIAIQKVSSLDESLYPDGMVQNLKTLAQQKQNIVNHPSSQEEIDDAALALNQGLLSLRMKPSPDMLESLSEE